MSQLANVWVFSDNVERYAELMTGARQYGKRVYAIVQGSAHVGRVKAPMSGASKRLALMRLLSLNHIRICSA